MPAEVTALEHLQLLAEDDSLLAELADLFRSSVVARMPDLHMAFRTGGWDAAARLAHEFKGAGANLGMAGLADRLAELERRARSQDSDYADVLREVDAELDRALHTLDAAIAAPNGPPGL